MDCSVNVHDSTGTWVCDKTYAGGGGKWNLSSSPPLSSPHIRLRRTVIFQLSRSFYNINLQKSGLTLIIFFVWAHIFILYLLERSVKTLNSASVWQIRNNLAHCSSAVPVKALEMNGLRGSFPPQSSLGYKGVVCLSYWCIVSTLLTVLGWGFQSHWRQFCSHQSISEWPLCKVASHNSAIDWHWIKLRQLDNGNGN